MGTEKLHRIFGQFQQYIPESMNKYPFQFKIMRVLTERLLVFQKSLLRIFKILPFLVEVIWHVYVLYFVFLSYFNTCP